MIPKERVSINLLNFTSYNFKSLKKELNEALDRYLLETKPDSSIEIDADEAYQAYNECHEAVQDGMISWLDLGERSLAKEVGLILTSKLSGMTQSKARVIKGLSIYCC